MDGVSRTMWPLLVLGCLLLLITGCGKKLLNTNAASDQYAQSGKQVKPYGQMRSLSTIMKDGLVDEENIQIGESTLHPLDGNPEINPDTAGDFKDSKVSDHSLGSSSSGPLTGVGTMAGESVEIVSIGGKSTDDEVNTNSQKPGNNPPQKGVTFSRDLRDVHFDFDSWRLSDSARETLEANAEWLKAHPHEHVTIEGHCDERGTQSYNYVLGEKRAAMVQQYLSFLGVPLAQLYVASYGKDRPACRTLTADCFDQNRRAHFNSSVNMVSQQPPVLSR